MIIISCLSIYRHHLIFCNTTSIKLFKIYYTNSSEILVRIKKFYKKIHYQYISDKRFFQEFYSLPLLIICLNLKNLFEILLMLSIENLFLFKHITNHDYYTYLYINNN